MNNRFNPWTQAESVHYASRYALSQPRFRYLNFLRLDAVNRPAIHAILFWSFESVPFDIVLVYLSQRLRGSKRANHHGRMG